MIIIINDYSHRFGLLCLLADYCMIQYGLLVLWKQERKLVSMNRIISVMDQMESFHSYFKHFFWYKARNQEPKLSRVQTEIGDISTINFFYYL